MNSKMPALREYADDQLDLQFSPAAWHPDREKTLAHHIDHGAEVADRLHAVKDVRYGNGPLQTMDIFPGPVERSPVCIAFHGGFWRTSDKKAFAFLGERMAKHGVGYFVVNFDMCPAVDIGTIIHQVHEALAWIQLHAGEYACDPSRMYLFGHATGAHLAASLLAGTSIGLPQFDRRALLGALLISGLYDLRRVPQLKVNQTLKLTPGAALLYSPLFGVHAIRTPIIIGVAANETPEFIAQSKDMAEATVRAGVSTQFRLVPDCGHFDILDTLLSPGEGLFSDFMHLIAG
jgi:arylformamidase